MVAELGTSVSAILVGGDIAYKGAADEYDVAMTWLQELAAVAGCPHERIFVVPGNHDVDRNTTRRFVTNAAQAALSDAGENEREQVLQRLIRDSDTAHALFAPLAAYNEFAKLLNCQVYPPDRLCWIQDLDLGHGVLLRLHGLTSTLLSGINGGNDTRISLYLSPLQTVFDPVDDVVNLVLCHHPPDWLMDQDQVDDAVCARAAIQMFGHKHRQRINQDRRYVRFSAGAVNPDRYELNWQPGYNLVEVRVDGENENRKLVIDAHLRQWQTGPDTFRAMISPEGAEVFHHEIGIPAQRRVTTPIAATPSVKARVPAEHPKASADKDANGEAAMGDAITRNLVFRFWQLQASERRDIALQLELISRDEMTLPEPERYGRALIRASENGKLEELARQVSQREAKQ